MLRSPRCRSGAGAGAPQPTGIRPFGDPLLNISRATVDRGDVIESVLNGEVERTSGDEPAGELELRLAREETIRVRNLVASHNRLHDLIARDAPLRDVLSELVGGIEEYEPSVMACVVLLDRESSTLHPGAGPSLPPHWLEAIDGVVIGPNIGSCGSAAWSGELVISEDLSTDPKWTPVREFAATCGLSHCWSMPIKSADGLVLGTFALYGPRPRAPQPEHIALMQDGARLAGIAIERRRTMERLIHDARYDGFDRASQPPGDLRAVGAGSRPHGRRVKVATLFIDLDGLKALNDTLGHDRADDMIREVAERLRPALRTDDFVGRFGGDEFVAIAEEVADAEQAAALAARLLEVTSAPLRGLEGTTVTASIGIALVDGEVDAAEAIRRADTAMYRAKQSGRDRYPSSLRSTATACPSAAGCHSRASCATPSRTTR